MSRMVELPAPGRGAYDRSLSRAERDAQHRERLLRAAAEVLAHGPATVARIVEHAGVGRGTFYEFFDSPDHILEHLEQRVLRAIELAIDEASSEARTPMERVRALTRSWLLALEVRRVEARIVLSPRAGSDLLSPAGALLHAGLRRVADASRLEGMARFNGADDVGLLAAAAAVEAVSRRHLWGQALPEAPRVLAELVAKLLR